MKKELEFIRVDEVIFYESVFYDGGYPRDYAVRLWLGCSMNEVHNE